MPVTLLLFSSFYLRYINCFFRSRRTRLACAPDTDRAEQESSTVELTDATLMVGSEIVTMMLVASSGVGGETEARHRNIM